MSSAARAVLALLAAALAACVESPDAVGTSSDEAEALVEICSTPVAFSAVAYEVPPILGVPRAERHVRDENRLVYVAGNYLDVVFTLPGCTRFTGVSRNGIWLGTSGGVDQSDYYQIVSDTAVGADHRVRVRLWISNAATGAGHALKIWAGNSMRDGARSHDFTLSGVHDISRPSKVSMSTVELKNNTATSFYKRFGDDGWERDENGEKTRVHDPDYANLDVRVEADHIWFRSSVKWRVYGEPFDCDVTATATGRFRLSRFNDGGTVTEPNWKMKVEWLDPDLSDPVPFTLDLSGGPCTLFVPDLVDGVVTALANTFVDAIKTSLDDDLVGGLECGAHGIEIDCAQAIERFEYSVGELRAVLDGELFDKAEDGVSITVRAPYVIVPGAGATGGVPVPGGSKVLVSQEGLVEACHTDVGAPATCNGGVRRRFGSSGLLNWAQPATWPVPHPFEYGWPAIPEREQALGAHVGLNRSPSTLPRSSANAAALLARVHTGASTVLRTLDRPCVLGVPAGATRSLISLGRNENAAGGVPYGTGQPLVTLRFVGFIETCGY